MNSSGESIRVHPWPCEIGRTRTPMMTVIQSNHSVASRHREVTGTYISTYPGEGFVVIPILQIKKRSLGNCQNQDLNPSSASTEPELWGTAWHHSPKGDQGQHRGLPRNGMSLWWTLRERWARPRELEGQRGLGHGNLVKKWAPECAGPQVSGYRVWTWLWKSRNLKINSRQPDRVWIIQLPCKRLPGFYSKSERFLWLAQIPYT